MSFWSFIRLIINVFNVAVYHKLANTFAAVLKADKIFKSFLLINRSRLMDDKGNP